MAFYSYKMTRDYGFAPNPFGEFCTLATCKPAIRRTAVVGDWILGTGSEELKLPFRAIYLMQISEKLSLEEYWLDRRFQHKKAIANGSLVTIHGDNVYSKNEAGDWCQADCQHSHQDPQIREKHIEKDTKGRFVLLSDTFYYFGNNHIEIADKFRDLCCKTQGHIVFRKDVQGILREAFIKDVTQTYSVGIHGKPNDWQQYDQLSLF